MGREEASGEDRGLGADGHGRPKGRVYAVLRGSGNTVWILVNGLNEEDLCL